MTDTELIALMDAEFTKPQDYRTTTIFKDGQRFWPVIEEPSPSKKDLGRFVRPSATVGAVAMVSERAGSCGVIVAVDPVVALWYDHRISRETVAELLPMYPELFEVAPVAPPVPTTAAEIIARYDALTAQIEALELQRFALPSVAKEWEADGHGDGDGGQVRNGADGDRMTHIYENGGGHWRYWERRGSAWKAAEPNTEAGAKACAEAALLADGVVLA